MCDESHLKSSTARVEFRAKLFDLLNVIEAENDEVDDFDRAVYLFEAVWQEFEHALKDAHAIFDAIPTSERRSVVIDI